MHAIKKININIKIDGIEPCCACCLCLAIYLCLCGLCPIEVSTLAKSEE